MNRGFPKFSHSAKQGELGINLVSRVISDNFGWLFRRNHQEHDFGIDGQIEVVTPDGAVTGQMIAVQVKCGETFLKKQNKWDYVYRGNTKHFNYLANYPIPVIICLCDPKSKESYWAHFQANQVQVSQAGWKMTNPFENVLSLSRAALQALVPPVHDSLKELESYWALNEMIVKSSAIFYMFDEFDVRRKDVSRPREFFDRLRSTRELAYECQGKVEFSFPEKDENRREQ